jgi:methylthioribose-1-phosphate isomerase
MRNFDRSIWVNIETKQIEVIDQRQLPFKQSIFELTHLQEVAFAIKEMVVRGAPLIGVTAAYGLYIAARDGIDLAEAYAVLLATRPTAYNLKWALDRQMKLAHNVPVENLVPQLLNGANQIAEEDIQMCSAIGENGLSIIASIYENKKRPVQILTHCNAGWLATVQWGTALAPIYKAHQAGIPVHVWVDETRPRNQGARLTAWELQQAEIPYTVIADNAGGHLMQHGKVDLVLVGSDRTTKNGDVCNKIGTYLKALAAFDNNVPFYAALPVSTIDWQMSDGLKEIPIEQRATIELTHMDVMVDDELRSIEIMPAYTPVGNYAFDVTPAKYITGIITERGVSKASEEDLMKLYL